MKGLIKFLIGLVLLPICIGLARSFILVIALFSKLSELSFLFLSGFAAYFIFELIFSKPIRTYVLGHELSHIVASLLCGGLPKKLKISKRGGSVSLTKTNFFISLAPYILPLYTCVVLGVYFIVKHYFNFYYIHYVFFAILGFSLAFHLRLTFFAVKQGQPDIEKTGVFFSLVFIVCVNLIVLVLLLKLLFPQSVNLARYFEDALFASVNVYIWIIGIMQLIISLVINKLRTVWG
ncbi:MAG: hypothetical protein ABII27_00950 [bacterium]